MYLSSVILPPRKEVMYVLVFVGRFANKVTQNRSCFVAAMTLFNLSLLTLFRLQIDSPIAALAIQ